MLFRYSVASPHPTAKPSGVGFGLGSGSPVCFFAELRRRGIKLRRHQGPTGGGVVVCCCMVLFEQRTTPSHDTEQQANPGMLLLLLLLSDPPLPNATKRNPAFPVARSTAHGAFARAARLARAVKKRCVHTGAAARRESRSPVAALPRRLATAGALPPRLAVSSRRGSRGKRRGGGAGAAHGSTLERRAQPNL